MYSPVWSGKPTLNMSFVTGLEPYLTEWESHTFHRDVALIVVSIKREYEVVHVELTTQLRITKETVISYRHGSNMTSNRTHTVSFMQGYKDVG